MNYSVLALLLSISGASAQFCATTKNNDWACGATAGQCCGVLTNCGGKSTSTYSNYSYVPPGSMPSSNYAYTPTTGGATSCY